MGGTRKLRGRGPVAVSAPEKRDLPLRAGDLAVDGCEHAESEHLRYREDLGIRPFEFAERGVPDRQHELPECHNRDELRLHDRDYRMFHSILEHCVRRAAVLGDLERRERSDYRDSERLDADDQLVYGEGDGRERESYVGHLDPGLYAAHHHHEQPTAERICGGAV
jgi:hypothetical protein